VRGQLAHPLDGRYGAMDTSTLNEHIRRLLDATPLDGIDFVLGIPEGGTAPAFAFAHEAGLPLVLASRFDNEAPGTIYFREPHNEPGADRFTIHGLRRGDRVLLVEDEITTGHTIVDCVRSLRAAGVAIDAVASLFAIDSPAMRERLDEERIALTVGQWLPFALLAEVGVKNP
jgi:adenine/guanine phosphoribosyltransferase-like PRPP-binding protein